jgi:hypothetical protein
MIVRLLLLERFVFVLALLALGYLHKETFFGQSPPIRSYILRLGTGMFGFHKNSFYETGFGRKGACINHPKGENGEDICFIC